MDGTIKVIELDTKANTLHKLYGKVNHANVLKLFSFNVLQWKNDSNEVLDSIVNELSGQWPLIVRSSALSEDTITTSAAGKYKSVSNVDNKSQLINAIEEVIESYGIGNHNNQVFVQKMLQEVSISGVAFTKDPNTGGHYYVINYDNTTGRLDTVTSGSSNDTKVYILEKFGLDMANIPSELFPIIRLLQELQDTFANDALDIEFAIKNDTLYLLQVRRLIMNATSSLDKDKHSALLNQASMKISLLSKPHPYLHGSKAVFGIMPDWNPAEIIGVRPRPLAMSLYKELITDGIWSYQRDNYGYRNLRSFPLMVSLAGLPYIDVRVSFNSFIPASIEEELASKLVNYYTKRLTEMPCYHDKVEFEIIFSCYTLDLNERMQLLKLHGFSESEITKITSSLLALTNNIISCDNGLWLEDRKKIDELLERQKIIKNSQLDHISKIFWLLEDCKRYGTLPFAGLARAGFIAIQLLQSLIAKGVLTAEQYASYMSSITTVSSNMLKELNNLSSEDFLKQYGHLRPGTYDILSKRYDEAPEEYFNFACMPEANLATDNFALSLQQLNDLEGLLQSHKLDVNVLNLFKFIRGAIEGREYAKFVFTRSLSDVLSLLQEFGQSLEIKREDMSFMDIGLIKLLYGSSKNTIQELQKSIADGKEIFACAQHMVMPPVITEPSDVYGFFQPIGLPNFITLKTFTGDIEVLSNNCDDLTNKIIMIPSADPGYDWIFSHNIDCFITMYGGLNSHMSIRAAELGIPAVIGAGELLYNRWKNARKLEVDCCNKKVNILQ